MQRFDLPWFVRVFRAGLEVSAAHNFSCGHGPMFRQDLLTGLVTISREASARPAIIGLTLTDGVESWELTATGRTWIVAKHSTGRAKRGRPPLPAIKNRNLRMTRLFPVFQDAAKDLRRALRAFPENGRRERGAHAVLDVSALKARLQVEIPPQSPAHVWLTDLDVTEDGLLCFGVSEPKRTLQITWTEFATGRFQPSELAEATLGAWWKVSAATVHNVRQLGKRVGNANAMNKSTRISNRRRRVK